MNQLLVIEIKVPHRVDFGWDDDITDLSRKEQSRLSALGADAVDATLLRIETVAGDEKIEDGKLHLNKSYFK